MAQKEIYTINIFTKDFVYKSSMQISDINYEIDYLDVVKSKIKNTAYFCRSKRLYPHRIKKCLTKRYCG